MTEGRVRSDEGSEGADASAVEASVSRAVAELERHEGAVLAGIVALVVVVLLPVLGFGFVYDDGWTFTANGFLRQPGDLPLLLSDEAARRHVPDAFRPTLVLFDVLSYQLFGLFAPAHHALSIALHVLVCALAQRWLRLLGAPLTLRAATLALFGLLAIHAEAIAVVSFHEDLVAAALGLGALVVASAAARARTRRGRWPRAAAAALLLTLACGAKMSAATLPLLWWLGESLSPWRPPAARVAGRVRIAVAVTLALGVGLTVVHTLATHGALSPYAGASNLRLFASRVGLSPVLAMSTQIHLGYLQQIALPFGLSPEYVDAGASWTAPATILASAALLGLLLYGLWAATRRRRALAAWAILGAFVLALPTANLAAMPNMRADRLMYLPSLPICVGLAALALAIGRRLAAAARAPALAAAPIVALAILQGALLQATTRVYRSPGALWTIASQRAPGSARAQAIYGEVLLASRDPAARDTAADRGRVASVRAHCRRALEIDPRDELSHLCAARLAIAEERWAAAQAHLRRALGLSVDRNHRILAALAEVSLDVPGVAEDRRRDAALQHLERATREYPYAVEVWTTAGRIYHRLGDPAAAEAAFARAFELGPERPESTLGAIEAALDRGDPTQARRLLVERAALLERADPTTRAALEQRLWDHLRLFPPPPSLVESEARPRELRLDDP
ncbi:MAG: tetratricopeptide repeat protein [Nannocystaceae bacterium]